MSDEPRFGGWCLMNHGSVAGGRHKTGHYTDTEHPSCVAFWETKKGCLMNHGSVADV